MTDKERRLLAAQMGYKAHRLAYLPRQLENTRRKLKALENEARSLGLDYLLEVA